MKKISLLSSSHIRLVLVVIIVIIFIVIGIKLFQSGSHIKFQRKVLLENTPSSMVTELMISPDSKWLIIRFLNEPNKFIVINLERGTKENVRYLDPLPERENCNYYFYWANNSELILEEQENRNYYLLNIQESSITLKQLSDFKPQGIRFSLWTLDNNNFCFRMSNDRGRFEKELPDLKLEFFGLPYSSIDTLSVSPNRAYIFYLLRWQEGFWKSRPNCLYFLDTKSKKSKKIDTDIMPWDPIIMFWTSNSKKFIYGKRLEPAGIKIIELTLQEQ